jgi:hypothetical protein
MMRTLIAAALALTALAPDAHAQVTISGGLGWSGGYGIGESTAQLRTNAPGATPPPFTLFNVDSKIGAAPGGEIRVGVAVAPRFTIEAGALFARRRLSFSISADPETGAQDFEGESLQHYVFDAALLWELPVLRGPRLRSFAALGGGYLRQLHQDRTLVESGQVYYVGGGARYWLRGRPDSNRSLGFRGDVRFNLNRNAIDFENATRFSPTVSLLMFLSL